MGFLLFLLVNAALFLRPGEIVPALQAVPVYNYLILACLVVSFPWVLEQLSPRALSARPITVCVLALLPAVFLSHAANLDVDKAGDSSFDFLKVVIYYLLFLANVNTPGRLRLFLLAVTVFAAGYAAVTVLNYHGLIDLSVLAPVKEKLADKATGLEEEVARLRGTSSNYGDPNDLCLVLNLGLLLSLCWIADRKLSVLRFAWVAPLVLFGYGLFLTQSRGGFLALLVGLAILFHARYGLRKSLRLGLVCLPLLFLVYAGRMTTISTGEATGQQRIQIWSDAFYYLREAPLFGIGMDEFSKRGAFVAHNSYLHAYAELGLFGGTLFLGAFYLALLSLRRMEPGVGAPAAPEVVRLQPYLLAVAVSYATAVLFLSQAYGVLTYLILGLAPVYQRVRLGDAPVPLTFARLDTRLVRRLAFVSIGFLAALYVFVRIFTHWA
jgi:O-antigen ligase